MKMASFYQCFFYNNAHNSHPHTPLIKWARSSEGLLIEKVDGVR